MEHLLKQNLKLKVLEEEVLKYKALVDCYKSETQYTSNLLSKTNKEKMDLFQEKKELRKENKALKEELEKLKSQGGGNGGGGNEKIVEVPIVVFKDREVEKEVIKEVVVEKRVEVPLIIYKDSKK